MLQIIKRGLVVFLFAIGVLSIYFRFNEKSKPSIGFYGNNSLKSVEIYLFKKNTPFNIIYDQENSRGNGHFLTIIVNDYKTSCGMVNIKMSFFNAIIYSIRLKNVSKLENVESCTTEQLQYFSYKNRKIHYRIINYSDYYDVDYYDSNLKDKVFDWIGKWS